MAQRTIIIIGPYPDDPSHMQGGVQASVYGLAHTLIPLHPEDHIQVIAPPLRSTDRRYETHHGNVKILYLNAPLKFLASGIFHAPHILRKITPGTIVHIHGTGLLQACIALGLRIKGRDCLWTLHGITRKETWRRFLNRKNISNYLRFLIYAGCESCLLRWAPDIIVDTPYVKNEITTRNNIHIIPQGIFMSEFQVTQKKPAPSPIVLSIGVLDARKGHHITIEAFGHVLQQMPEARLVIAGSVTNQAYHQRLTDLAAQHNIQHAVMIIPNASREVILDLLASATIFALHSQEESQGIALCEALASGLPIITTKVGGIPYVVQDGETGILVDYGNVSGFAAAIEQVLSDRVLHRRLSRQALVAAQHYDWQACITRIDNLYNSLAPRI